MEETPTPAESLPKHAAKYGAIIAGIMIALTIIFYAVALGFLASFKFVALSLFILIGFVIYGGIDYRKSIGGFMPYGKAWTHGFVVMAVCGLITTIFNILLYGVIDPELPMKMAEAIMANTESTMRSFGAPEDSIEQALAGMKLEMPKQFSTVGLLIGFGKGLIVYAVVSLITALFVRKNVPEEM